MRFRLTILLAMLASTASAQVRPGVFTTVNTTDTSDHSVCVGCAVGSTTAGGGLKATTISGTGAATFGSTVGITGLLTTGAITASGVITATSAALTTPVFTGTITGTYTLGGTPTIPASGLTGTITSATQDAITRLGTIVSGVWNGTKIGLLYGGTNADLTATGGTNQLLKQNSLGGAVTVGTISTSNLSDTANIPLLSTANGFLASPQTVTASNAVWAATSTSTTSSAGFSGTNNAGEAAAFVVYGSAHATRPSTSWIGTQSAIDFVLQSNNIERLRIASGGVLTYSGLGLNTFTASGNSANSLQVSNQNSGAAATAVLRADSDAGTLQAQGLSSGFTPSGVRLASGGVVQWDGTGGLSVAAAGGSAVLRFYSNGTTIRGTFGSTGGFTVGSTATDSGTGTVNAQTGYYINGTQGASHAACSTSVTAITVTGGIITAITCT